MVMFINISITIMDKKIKKTFTLDKEIYDIFCVLADKLAINKSKFIENKIKEFITKNNG
jgi:hypothetical protein